MQASNVRNASSRVSSVSASARSSQLHCLCRRAMSVSQDCPVVAGTETSADLDEQVTRASGRKREAAQEMD